MTGSDDQPPRPGVERDDAVLVRATLAGDNFAFDELVERYQGKIYGLALGVTDNPQDARDATQNVFLKAYQGLEKFDPSYKFFSWIYRIGLNESLNLVKRRRSSAPLDDHTPDPGAGPERTASSRETGRTIRQAIAELSPDLRVTVVLRHMHGLTYAEMSSIIGVPVERVKSRLFSARVKLRGRLSEEGLGPSR